jgi:ABC-type uncharacterized transport system substrate-binding protein
MQVLRLDSKLKYRLRDRIRWPIALLMGCSFAVQPAFAHPHVFTDMRSLILLSAEGLVTGVRVEWVTDPVYARDALDGLDANNDGVYQPEELARLTEENLSALADYDYFVFFRYEGEPQKHGKAMDGLQTYDVKDGRLTLRFTVPLETPLDPQRGEIRLKIYDPEYYIDFQYVKTQPLLISQPVKAGCSANLMEVPADPIAAQTKSLLATKDKDWKPEDGEDFGGLFAQPIVIRCGP